MTDILKGHFGNPHSSIHLHGRDANTLVETARERVAKLIGSEATNIIFTSGATESNNFLISQGVKLNPGKKTILVSALEHKCVLETAYELRKNGYKIIVIKTDEYGYIDMNHYHQSLNHDVALVSIMCANNEIGTINNMLPLIDAAHLSGSLFHTDAAQYITHDDLDVDELNVDFLSLSSHKMYGPIGIGAAYIAPHLFERFTPMILGGGQQDGKRSGTLSPLLRGGFGEAAHQFSTVGNDIRREIKNIRNYFYDLLNKHFCDEYQLIGPSLDQRHFSNLNIKFHKPASIILGMGASVFSASNGSACSSGEIKPSHVLRAIGLSAEEADKCIRFSFGVGLNFDDMERVTSKLKSIL